MNIIVVGCGRVGSELATLLSEDGHNVSVVDRRADAFKNLGHDFNGRSVKGIGFDLRDGSIYDGKFSLMEAGKLTTETIGLVEHYRESPLVQQAVADCRSLLEEKEQQVVLDAADGAQTPTAKSNAKKSVLADLLNKKSRVNGVNAPKELNRPKREEMEQA